MSTFAVFGMTRDQALAEARKTVKTTRKTPQGDEQLTMSEWTALCEKRADEIMCGCKIKQLSPLFDAPPVRQGIHRSSTSDAQKQKPSNPLPRRPEGRDRAHDHQQENRRTKDRVAGLPA